MSEEHTPLPWTTKAARFGGDVGIVANGCQGVIAECFEEFVAKGDVRPVEAAANAEFIVRACNSHEALLSALHACAGKLAQMARIFNSDNFTDRYQDGPMMERLAADADAAIKKAEGA